MVGRLRRLFGRQARAAARKAAAEQAAIRQYLHEGRRPWAPGYLLFRDRFIAQCLADPELLETFRSGKPLPAGHGPHLDERAVEFPWVLAQLAGCGNRVLDAGSTLNHAFLLDHLILKARNLVIYTLSPEQVISRASISYVYGDLRSTILRDGCIDAVACVSTLEHVGMDNTLLYTADAAFNECSLTDYRQVVAEFRRVLRPGGVALITVPFGRRMNLGWAQQFDRTGIDDIVRTFGGRLEEARYYRYRPDGWVLATAEECADCEYFDIHSATEHAADFAAAARAVACLRLVRP